MLAALLPLVKTALPYLLKGLDNENDRDHIKKSFAELEAELTKEVHKTNQVEAANRNLFVSGWRPAIGWICAVSIGFNFAIVPIFNALTRFAGSEVYIPMMTDTGPIMGLLMGMLGIGGLRTIEKSKGITK